jgi:hypothetical protein
MPGMERPLAEGTANGRNRSAAKLDLVNQSTSDHLAAAPSSGNATGVVTGKWDGGLSLVAPSIVSVTATCAVCGRDIRWLRADARYCSNACKQRSYRARNEGRRP